MLSDNTRRIAKNTGFLYIRMLIMMGVMFYTSRVVLNALGVDDYGIYNVVGGVVAMFSFLTATFTGSTQRFMNYEMGRGNQQKLCHIFSMSMTLNVLIAALVLIICEVAGLWFINNKLIIPADRLYAAHWVFQLSLLAMVVTIVSTPYNAVIIAHERMKIFAWISVLDGFLRLAAAVIVFYCRGDKLIIYGFLVLGVSVIIRLVYSVYCKRTFSECRYRFYWDKTLFKQMGGFAGWNLYGNFSFLMITQGLNILLNMFFGPAANASRAIAVQVQSAIQGFASNFTMAVDPRITQDYAQGKTTEMFKLICFSSKYSFFLLLVLSFPVLVETEAVLKIWLKQVPEYSVIFVRLILLQMLIRILQSPLHTAMHATGKMKKYQLVDGTLLLLNIPVSYILLHYGFDAPSVFVVSVIISFIALLALLYVLKGAINFPVWRFGKEVFLPVFEVCICLLILYIPFYWLPGNLSFYVRLFIRVGGAFVLSCLAVWILGIRGNEKTVFKSYLDNVYRKWFYGWKKRF